MKESTALIVVSADLVPVIAESATEAKDAALQAAALVGVITKREQKPSAVSAQMKVATILKAVEKERKRVKEPFLEACRAIDAAAAKFVKDLEGEQMRLAKAVGDFDAQELEEARQAERERQEELRRIAEQEAAERRRIEADAHAAEEARLAEARKQEEARQAELRRIAEEERAAKTKADRARLEKEKAAMEQRRKEQETEFAAQRERERIAREAELQRQKELAAQAAEAVGPEKQMAKVEGQRVTAKWKAEVTDIWLLAKMHPGFVEIKPRMSEINQALAMGVREIKGCRVFEEVQSTVTTSGRKAIEV